MCIINLIYLIKYIKIYLLNFIMIIISLGQVYYKILIELLLLLLY